MKKILELVLSIAALSMGAYAQAPVNNMSIPGDINSFQKTCFFQQGSPIYCDSNLVDTGSVLLYSGVPVATTTVVPGNVTPTGGTGITPTCTVVACTNTRGSYSLVGTGGAGTGTAVHIAFSSTLSTVPVCFAWQNGGTAFKGIGNSVATNAGFDITAGVTLASTTVVVNYVCLK